MKNEWKMDKIYQYGWKTVEMDENMIGECMNPRYWWIHNIDEPTVYAVFSVVA
jgi:Zn-dependent M32 family carboxypeptidase